MEEPDGQLVGWSRVHDPRAFAELVGRHGAAVHSYLARRAGRQDADDLLSEVWLRAFARRATYDSSWADARPWLYGIARNVVLNHLRRQGRPVALPAALSVDPWPDTDSRIDASGQWSELCQALRTISEGDREVLLLVAWEGLTPTQAALVLDIPPATARSRLFRARQLLRHHRDQESSPRTSSVRAPAAQRTSSALPTDTEA